MILICMETTGEEAGVDDKDMFNRLKITGAIKKPRINGVLSGRRLRIRTADPLGVNEVL